MPRNLLRKRTYSQRRSAKYTKPKRTTYVPVRKSWNSSYYKKRSYRRSAGLRKYKAGQVRPLIGVQYKTEVFKNTVPIYTVGAIANVNTLDYGMQFRRFGNALNASTLTTSVFQCPGFPNMLERYRECNFVGMKVTW